MLLLFRGTSPPIDRFDRVQLQSVLIGLTSFFKQKYDDDAPKIAEVFGEQMGTRLGNQTREKAGIESIDRSSIQDIARESVTAQ